MILLYPLFKIEEISRIFKNEEDIYPQEWLNRNEIEKVEFRKRDELKVISSGAVIR